MHSEFWPAWVSTCPDPCGEHEVLGTFLGVEHVVYKQDEPHELESSFWYFNLQQEMSNNLWFNSTNKSVETCSNTQKWRDVWFTIVIQGWN